MSSDGEVQGVGLLIAQEPTSGRLVVLAPIRGGPADKAGVLPGDEVSTLHLTSSRTFGLCCPMLLILNCSRVMRHATCCAFPCATFLIMTMSNYWANATWDRSTQHDVEMSHH